MSRNKRMMIVLNELEDLHTRSRRSGKCGVKCEPLEVRFLLAFV